MPTVQTFTVRETDVSRRNGVNKNGLKIVKRWSDGPHMPPRPPPPQHISNDKIEKVLRKITILNILMYDYINNLPIVVIQTHCKLH